MAKFTAYPNKTKPADSDTLLINDASASANKQILLSGLFAWLKDKFTSTPINGLETTNQTIVGAINELHDAVEEGGSASDIEQIRADLEDLDERVEALEESSGGDGGGSGLTSEVKDALLAIFQHVAYTDSNGQTYYDALEEALYPTVTTRTVSYSLSHVTSSNNASTVTSGASYTATLTASSGYTINTVTVTMGGTDVTSTVYSSGTITIPSVTGNIVITATAVASVSSISAVYTQSGTVYTNTNLDSLKSDLVVTAIMSDQTTIPVTDYTLSGTLAEGTSTITVSYGGKTTTFNVTVTDASIMSIAQGNITNSLSETDRVTVIFNQTTFNPSNVMTFTAVDGYQVYVFDMNATSQDKAGTVQGTNKLNVYAVTSTGVVYSGATVKSRLSFTLGWDTAKTITCTATDFGINCTGYGIMVKSTDGSALTPQQARSVFTKTMG